MRRVAEQVVLFALLYAAVGMVPPLWRMVLVSLVVSAFCEVAIYHRKQEWVGH
jgi:hypothetical protein